MNDKLIVNLYQVYSKLMVSLGNTLVTPRTFTANLWQQLNKLNQLYGRFMAC